MRRLPLAFVAMAITTLVLPLTPARADTVDVEVHSDYFKASRIRIEPGDTVRWNVVDTGHTITSDDGAFEFPEDAPTNGASEAGDTFEHTFVEKGVYFYRCRFHGQA